MMGSIGQRTTPQEYTKVYLGHLPNSVTADVIRDVVGPYGPIDVYMLPKGTDGYNASLVSFNDYMTAAACVESVNKEHSFAQYNTATNIVIAKLHSSDKVEGAIKLFVGSLLPGTSEIHLIGVFNKFGRIIDVKTFQQKMKDNLISGYVVFESSEAATAALGLNGTFIDGICDTSTPMVVKVATKSNKPLDPAGDVKVFIGNIPPGTRDVDLLPTFQQYGTVKSLNVLTRKVNSDGMICAFCVYEGLAAANSAVAGLNGAIIPGLPKELAVKIAAHQDKPATVPKSSGHISGIKLFVGCIPPDTREFDLRAHFGYGYNGLVSVMLNQRLNKSGDASALLIYDCMENANAVIVGCNGHYLRNRPYKKPLIVKLADKQDHNNPQAQHYATHAGHGQFGHNFGHPGYGGGYDTYMTHHSQGGGGGGGTAVKVLNLPPGYTNSDVRDLFETYGKVVSISLNNTAAHCSGEVQFTTAQAATEAADELNNLQMGQYRLKTKVKAIY